MNKVVHFEIPADDLDRAKKFYSQLFGWQLVEWPLPDGSIYTGAITVPIDEKTSVPKEPGAINGALVARDSVSRTPQVTVNVASIDDVLTKVTGAGGKVLRPKTKVADVGYYAYVSDTEGNLLGVWEDAKR